MSSVALLWADRLVLITITLSVSRPARGIFLRGVHAVGEPFQGRRTMFLTL